MRRRFLEVTGFVLAGGASRRMGRPKHELKLDGETMLMRQLRLLHAVCGSTVILGPPERVRPQGPEAALVPVIADRIPGCGPLGGIYTGLSITRTDYNLLLGCDLPFIEAAFLRLLCRCAMEGQADVTVPMRGRRDYQPVCAVYRRRALAVVRSSILRRDYKVTGFFHRVICQTVALGDLREWGYDWRIFTNVNTPEEYQAVVRVGDWGLEPCDSSFVGVLRCAKTIT
jgi:molybdenum cofactor guanylyltransferase